MEESSTSSVASSVPDLDASSLSDLFEKGFQLYNTIQLLTVPTNSPEAQDQVKKAISCLEKATMMVNELSIFSTNEEFEEVATADIKYFLLPAILGSLTTKMTTRDRSDVLNASEIYFKDYLRRLKSYSFTNVKIPEPPNGEVVCPSSEVVRRNQTQESLEGMARERSTKLDRFKRQKELQAKEVELRKRIDAEEIEDETAREYYRTMLDSWILTALEELESIEKEKPILEYMSNIKASQKKGGQVEQKMPERKSTPLRPIIIARNELQKKVMGLGYPSRPVMTVDEFYAKRYPENHKAEQNEAQTLSMQYMAEDPDRTKNEIETENAEKEEKEEREDPVHYIRERNWDDWRDDHRRGFGNRKNMG